MTDADFEVGQPASLGKWKDHFRCWWEVVLTKGDYVFYTESTAYRVWQYSIYTEGTRVFSGRVEHLEDAQRPPTIADCMAGFIGHIALVAMGLAEQEANRD